jgi:hypothetical protein
MTTNKGLNQPANGSNVDTWDVPVNNNFGWIDQAFGSTTALNATSGSATLADTQYRSLALAVSGAIAANVTYTIPTSVGGQWIVYNTTTDSAGGPWTITIASGGGGTSVVIQRNKATIIVSDGTNIRSVYAEAVTATPAFPSGTAMLFVQTSAPTGWTKSTTHDNKALRIVSGAASSGGTTGFTSVFTARTITTSNMPAHTHGVTDPGHTHTFSSRGDDGVGGVIGYGVVGYNADIGAGAGGMASAVTGITINSAGSGTAMDFAVQYVDVIIATKD